VEGGVDLEKKENPRQCAERENGVKDQKMHIRAAKKRKVGRGIQVGERSQGGGEMAGRNSNSKVNLENEKRNENKCEKKIQQER